MESLPFRNKLCYNVIEEKKGVDVMNRKIAKRTPLSLRDIKKSRPPNV